MQEILNYYENTLQHIN